MTNLNFHPAGRHFLGIPGPSPVPDRLLRAMSYPTIDHRGPEFGALGREVLDGIKRVFKTSGPVLIFPSSATGCWEAALVNCLSPGDRVLMFDTGHFATLWRDVAVRLGLSVEFVPGDWRRGVDPATVEARLAEDRSRTFKAVAVVHNETSTGVASRVGEVRRAIDRAGHPALFMVDTVSSLGCIDYRHDEWGVDVCVSGSQKGLMLPPGLGFNAVSQKALQASRSARLPRSYWDWENQLKDNQRGYFPYTPSTNLLYGLREAIAMLMEWGLEGVFARHARHAEATRRAVRAWGLELVCAVPEEYSASVTAAMMPAGHDADALRTLILDRFDLSLGTGLGRLKGKAFRIGHLGDLNEGMLLGALGLTELAMAATGLPVTLGAGVAAAQQVWRGAAA